MSDAPTHGSSTLVSGLVRSIDLRGPAGRMEALLNTGKEDAPYAAVIAHPHPLFGGTMHNKVVYHAMKSFLSFGIPVLRFNFRGAGLSEGTHDNGYGEVAMCAPRSTGCNRSTRVPFYSPASPSAPL
jgi:hypothetical protein